MSTAHSAYELVDSGDGRKLERFGSVLLDRPCSQAVWRPQLGREEWERADGVFTREPKGQWTFRTTDPGTWTVSLGALQFELALTEFGHVGVFPEHRRVWERAETCVRDAPRPPGTIEVLNLFAYSGAATLALAHTGAAVCHLDASRTTVDWARRNAALNRLDGCPVRWIVEDARKYLRREVRRGHRYDGIVLDPPSFGRGTRQQVFKIETHLRRILDLCRQVLRDDALFVVLSCHTPGYTPTVLTHLLSQTFGAGPVEAGELLLEGGGGVLPVPSGAYAVWTRT